MIVCNPWAIWYMLMEEEEEMENRFNSYTYTDERHLSTPPTRGTKVEESSTRTHRYYRKRLRKIQ